MQVGRVALAILLLQDFIVVPLLVIVPILGAGEESVKSLPYILGNSLLKAVFALGVIFIIGRVLLRPLFSFITPDHNESSELPIAVTLLTVPLSRSSPCSLVSSFPRSLVEVRSKLSSVP